LVGTVELVSVRDRAIIERHGYTALEL
jgi:hypothetical protein